MSDIFLSLILGLIQGLTEFLPISSSAHLLIPSLVFGANDLGLGFDIAVHAGTLCAVIYFFKNDLKVYALSIFNSSNRYQNERRVAINLLIATIPIVFAGILFNDLIALEFNSKRFNALQDFKASSPLGNLVPKLKLCNCLIFFNRLQSKESILLKLNASNPLNLDIFSHWLAYQVVFI